MPRPKKGSADREPTLIVEIRAAIEEAKVNCYALAMKAGIDESAVRKFVKRERSLSLDSAARLADALGVKVTRPAKPRKFSGSEPKGGDPC